MSEPHLLARGIGALGNAPVGAGPDVFHREALGLRRLPAALERL